MAYFFAIFLAYLAGAALLWLFQRGLIYYPDTSRPDPAKWRAPDAEVVRVTTQDGLAIEGWLLPGRAGAPVIAIFHGNAGNLGMRALKFGFLRDAGYPLYLAGYRGYGGNPGRPSEAGLMADADAQLDALAARGFVGDQLILYGESLGTGVATAMAAAREIRALVLEAPYTRIADVAQVRFPIYPASLLVRDRFESVERIAGIDAPLQLLHGQRDITIPVRFGKALFAAASEPRHLFISETAGHNTLYEHGAGPVVLEFLERYAPLDE